MSVSGAAIASLAEDRVVEGVYAVARKERRRTRAGSAYLALELQRPAEVVQQGRRQDEIGAESRMKLSGLPAQRRDADGVLEQPASVGVVALGRRQPAHRPANEVVGDEAVDEVAQPPVRDLAREELEEAVELRSVPPKRGRQRRRVVGSRLQ